MTPMMARSPRVALKTMGCRLNRVETDAIALALEQAGCELVSEGDADALVINTCAVTAEAEAKCRKMVRHALALPSGPVVVATGCMATLFSDELADLSDNVKVETDKGKVAKALLDLAEKRWQSEDTGDDRTPVPSIDMGAPTPTGRTRPGVKVQDGCDNRCTFCIVWKARGAARSVSPDEAANLVRQACERGAHEVVLSGINLGSYRYDWHGSDLRLPGLLAYLMDNTDVDRLRLSSMEPPDITRELCEVIASSDGRVAPFLHVCLQSGCDATLRRMGRVYDTDLYRRVVNTARELIPSLALGCDLIVGFPGETDAEFEDSLAFCREMDFAKVHVFRYSRRPGTPAATMPDQVASEVAAERSRRMRELADRMRRANAGKLVGRRDLALVQVPGRAVSSGLFDVLVDADLAVDSLAWVTPHGVQGSGTLDARTALKGVSTPERDTFATDR